MQRMAKGKHAPSVGAVRQNKVLHPSSRKVQKISHTRSLSIKPTVARQNRTKTSIRRTNWENCQKMVKRRLEQ